MVKFKNPNNHLVTFNAAKSTPEGGIKNKWITFEPLEVKNLTDPNEIACARKQNQLNRIQNELKGFLEEVADDTKTVTENKIEENKQAENPVVNTPVSSKPRGRPPAVH